jgi:hypothetical protein
MEFNNPNIAPPVSASFYNITLNALTSSAVQDTGISDPAVRGNISFAADQTFYISFSPLAAGPTNVPPSGALNTLTGSTVGPFPIGISTFRVTSAERYFKALSATAGHLTFWNSSGEFRV